MKFGILFQPGAVWLGAHYAPYNKRLCINIIPFLTIWIVGKGGQLPHGVT
jgi:hypothetical protein